MRPSLIELGDAVPQPPWDLSLYRCASRRGQGWSRAASVEDRPALLLFAASRRRSGCVPAEPYPPLKQPKHEVPARRSNRVVRSHPVIPLLLAHACPVLLAQTCPVLLAPRHKRAISRFRGLRCSIPPAW